MIYAHSLKNSQKLSYYEICSYMKYNHIMSLRTHARIFNWTEGLPKLLFSCLPCSLRTSSCFSAFLRFAACCQDSSTTSAVSNVSEDLWASSFTKKLGEQSWFLIQMYDIITWIKKRKLPSIWAQVGETNISVLHFTVFSLLLLDVDHGILLGISCEDVGLPNILVMAREMVSDSSNTWKHENKCCRTVSLSMITYISSSSRQAWEERQEKWEEVHTREPGNRPPRQRRWTTSSSQL